MAVGTIKRFSNGAFLTSRNGCSRYHDCGTIHFARQANGENAASATRIVSEGEGLPSGKSLPTDEKELRFLGMWAADAALCKEMAWRFSEHELRTPAGSVCQFSTISEAQGGYDIQARCTSEGPPTDDVLSLRFAESAQAMLFESDSIADAGLVYCGPLEQE